jgi:hypothetical protein
MAGLRNPVSELFTELDQLHFGGRLTAAGWKVKAYFFKEADNVVGGYRPDCAGSARSEGLWRADR